jgi:Tetratricopeptide repeat.
MKLGKKRYTLRKIKRYKEALVCYNRALTIKPDHSESQLKRRKLLSELQAKGILTENNKSNSHVNLNVSNKQDEKLKKTEKSNPIPA